MGEGGGTRGGYNSIHIWEYKLFHINVIQSLIVEKVTSLVYDPCISAII